MKEIFVDSYWVLANKDRTVFIDEEGYETTYPPYSMTFVDEYDATEYRNRYLLNRLDWFEPVEITIKVTCVE